MKYYRIFTLFILVGLLLVACGSQEPTNMQEEETVSQEPANLLETVQDRGTLIVGTSADYAPYEYVDEAGNFVGYDMDLIREIGNRMGLEVEIRDLGFDALIAAVQGHKVDVVIAAMSVTPERDEAVDFTMSYNAQAQAILVVGGSSIEVTAPTDMADYKIGVQAGTTLEDWLIENLIDAGLTADENVSRYERADQIALDLQAGRIDIGFIDVGPAQELVSNMDVIIAYTDFIAATGQAIALPEGEAELQAELNQIIQQLIDEGFIQELEDTHLQGEE